MRLERLLALRRAIGRENGLAPVGVAGTGSKLRHPELSRRFAEEPFGVWRASTGALDVVEASIANRRPATVIEFGSGVSTVCLARYLADVHGAGDAFRLISVEQDAGHAAATRDLLAEHGAPVGVRVVHSPLVPPAVEGGDWCYERTDELAEIADAPRPRLAFIDGPGQTPGASGAVSMRHGVVPLLADLIDSPCRILFDDALDDPMLLTAQRWSSIPGVSIEGVLVAGRGVGVGWVDPRGA